MARGTLNVKATAIALSIAVAGLVVLYFSTPYLMEIYMDYQNGNEGGDNNQTVSLPVVNLTVNVTFSNGTSEIKSNVSLPAGSTTVFNLMVQEFTVEYDVYSNGYFITVINGDDGGGLSGGWIYEVDGIPPGVASNYVELSNNSVIEWETV